MAGFTSFYFAIFRKFQAICGGVQQGHVNPDSAPWDQLYGGFSLQSTQDPQGIFGQLGPQASHYPPLSSGLRPLNPASIVPADNPLWVMLNTSLEPSPPTSVLVNGQTWPVMPPPPENEFASWLAWNAAPTRLIDAFGTWIGNGKVDDAPSDAPISYAALAQANLAHWPQTVQDPSPILFVASMPGDDGRRHGDHSTPDPSPSHVPANFWATSQIFLTYPPGVPGHAAGTTATPASLKPGEEYWVAAIIGNAGQGYAGDIIQFNNPKCLLLGDAQCFNTFTSPGTPLPSLDNIDPTDPNPVYEEFALPVWRYDVVGFRFNVDTVFTQLKAALAQLPPAMLGGALPADWLKAGHPCVKVRVIAGELANIYLPAGSVTAMPPTLDSQPPVDRHIAQHNLAPFNVAEMGLKKIMWTNFIVAQAGAGWNELTLQQALPADAFRFTFAIPRAAWERWIRPRPSKGGVVRGLEVVTDAPSKPFPDAVILRQTGPVLIRIADHGHERERFFGMSLGIEGDPAQLRRARDSTVSVVHAAQEGGVVGGFTLQVPVVR
jgi:hypothetical protein